MAIETDVILETTGRDMIDYIVSKYITDDLKLSISLALDYVKNVVGKGRPTIYNHLNQYAASEFLIYLVMVQTGLTKDEAIAAIKQAIGS